MILTVRPATRAEALWMADHLREEDKQEIETVTGRTASVVLLDSFLASRGRCYTARLTDAGNVAEHPCAIFGVADGTAGDGVVWLLATLGVRHCAISLLREAAFWIDHWCALYGVLHNIVDTRNALHIRWLRLLGFRREGATLTINGQTFKHMVKRRCAE